MFAYLRIFSLVSLVVVTIISALAGTWVRNIATDDLTRMFERSMSALAQGYVNSVWHNYRDTVLPLTLQGDPQVLRSNETVLEFARATSRYFQQMPLVRVNIYSAQGKLLMTSNINKNRRLPVNPASPDASFIVTQMSQTRLGSQVLSKSDYDKIPSSYLLQTLIPIRGADDEIGPPEGAVEILYDITEPWENLWISQIYGTGGVVVVFLLFLGILSVTSRHTEAEITKQHEINIELAAQAAAAQAETQQKSQFLANVSHELRTPLNAIIGFSEIIKNEVISTIHDQKYHTYINDINSSGVHLLSLINDILDYSKAEAGKLELEVSEVNLNRMVQNCLRLVSPRAEAGGIKLIEELPKEACSIVTDSKRFKQILLNLLSNAVKFTPEGGEIHVGLWANVEDSSYKFEVRDTGIGIAPKDISRAMSPFGQVDNTLKRKYEGTGLGLPLTKKFVELLGGKFSIESELGKGTTVSFNLPYELTAHDGVVIKQAT